MPDIAPRRRIRAQASPRDPSTMRFILDAPVQDGCSARFDGTTRDAPLAQALFAIDGVKKAQVTGETILVTRAPGADWRALKGPVAAAIRRALDGDAPPLGEAPDAASEDDDAALLEAVTRVLDARANPSIASHGGSISAESVENGVVYLRMSGGCQGCSASAVTLRQGVETILRSELPAIREIVDVTDHAGGQNPFYGAAPGQSALMSRPVPAGAVRWVDGELAIDPEYLAPRLGLKPDQLAVAWARGDIVITTETSLEPTPGRTRVVARSPKRAWAAEIAPDGAAHEIPPPRAAPAAEHGASPLTRRVRAYLEALPEDKLPITYGRLARGLGMYAPGSIRKVTGALEATMREDAAAGRAFIAARVGGRGGGGVPGKGFFELARALGRGPRPGESEAAFQRRQMLESFEAGRSGGGAANAKP
ncbi:NifU family protein [Pikeienuella sp. HZG-20]|uniref:NifU family protein n=1 Tax=Paludibacillus litoralis TaxID=3133267 RepID=UPI0030EB6A9A